MSESLKSEFQVDSIDTIGELVTLGFDKVFSGLANPITDVLSGFSKQGLITNLGFDLNWDKTFDPNYINGVFFITIKDLRVINQQDYVDQYPLLEGQNADMFLRWANQEKVNIPIKNAKVHILGNTFKPLMFFEPKSQLVINEVGGTRNTIKDENNIVSYIPTSLVFNFISDMVSNNWTKNERLYLPIVFTYNVPAKPFSPTNFITGLLFGETARGDQIGLLNNPIGFANHNWFGIFLLGCVLLVGSLIYKNFNSGGNSKISIYGNDSGYKGG